MEASNLQELKDAATELMRFTCNSCEQRFCECALLWAQLPYTQPS